MTNLLWDFEMALLNKEWKNGVSCCTQNHCSCSLTDKGFRIYRTPNIPSADHDMWGGLRLQSPLATETYLQKGHTYIILFDVEGQTSNRISKACWSNNMGWEDGGLLPTPSNIAFNGLPVNFQGKTTFYYKWTINDDLYKVCSASYSTFVEGETYLSYRDFAFGFGYQDTGPMGTDIYLSNFRMYDLTNEKVEASIASSGNVIFTAYNEDITPPPYAHALSGEIYTSDIWEI